MVRTSHFLALSGLRVKPENAQFLAAAAGLRETCGPRHGFLVRGQFEHREAAVELGRPRIAAVGDRAVSRDEYGRYAFVDAAAEDVDAAAFASSITA